MDSAVARVLLSSVLAVLVANLMTGIALDTNSQAEYCEGAVIDVSYVAMTWLSWWVAVSALFIATSSLVRYLTASKRSVREGDG